MPNLEELNFMLHKHVGCKLIAFMSVDIGTIQISDKQVTVPEHVLILNQICWGFALFPSCAGLTCAPWLTDVGTGDGMKPFSYLKQCQFFYCCLCWHKQFPTRWFGARGVGAIRKQILTKRIFSICLILVIITESYRDIYIRTRHKDNLMVSLLPSGYVCKATCSTFAYYSKWTDILRYVPSSA